MLNYKKLLIDFDSNKKATNRALADLLKIPEATFRTRRDRHNFTPDDIERIADFFGRTIAYYFDREEKQAAVYKNDEKMQIVEDKPCPDCAVLQNKINKLNEDLIESQKETIAALRGEHKKENSSTNNQKAG